MELEKTTIMSAIVCVSGILAEVMFNDALSKSIFGIVLSIIIAIMVIISTYFTLDGINAVLCVKKDNVVNNITSEQFICQENMLNALESKIDEQIKLLQTVYEKLDKIASRDEDALEIKKAVDEINTNTLQSAKIIVKYQMKNSAELKEAIDLVTGDRQHEE